MSLKEQCRNRVMHWLHSPHVIWNHEFDLFRDGGRVYKTNDLESRVEVLKGECTMDLPISSMLHLLTTQEGFTLWDNYHKGWNVFRFEEGEFLQSSVFIPLPVAPRDFVTQTWLSGSPEGDEFVISWQSVTHSMIPEEEGFVRGHWYPSCFLLRKDPNNPQKTILIFLYHADLKLEAEFAQKKTNGELKHVPDASVPVTIVERIYIQIRSYVHRMMLERSNHDDAELRKVTFRFPIVARLVRDISDAFMIAQINEQRQRANWRKIFQSHCGTAWQRNFSNGENNRTILSFFGCVEANAPAQLVYERILDGQFDYYSDSQMEVMQDYSGNAKFCRFTYGSATFPGLLAESYIFLGHIATGSGICAVMFRTAESSMIPPSKPGHMRMSFEPSAFFIFPTQNGKCCLISYCIQIDSAAYYSIGVKPEILEQSFIFKCLSIQIALEKMPEKPKIERGVVHTTAALEIYASLCKEYIRQHERSTKLSQEIKKVERKRKRTTGMDAFSDRLEAQSTKIRIPNWSITNLLQSLPMELILKIMTFLPVVPLLRLSATSRRFKLVAEDNSLWKMMFQRSWPDCEDAAHEFSHLVPAGIQPSFTDWKLFFKAKFVVESNWRRGRFERKVVPAHQKKVTCVDYDTQQGILASSSSDSEVKLWKLNTKEPCGTLSASDRGVLSCAIVKDTIACGHNDGSAWTWNLGNDEKKRYQFNSQHKLMGFRFLLYLQQPSILNWDSTAIMLWNLSTGRISSSWSEHSQKITCVEVCGNKVVSGSADKLVKMWDLEAGKCVETFNGHAGKISCVDLNEKYLAAASGKVIRLWNLKTPSTATNYVCDTPIKCVRLQGYKVVFGVQNGIHVWDYRFPDHLDYSLEISADEGTPTCVQCDEKRIICGTSKGNVIFWEVITL
eukprot:TRINITY_DN1442_c0_g1_i2.p1 TRINITY_DN1442_c0_g1~~TRINITY_DN1442_c0_g1_i2.p1  ORF type:complete len:899 (+),score=177.83 TRINITY_DN1442_c0_g1_i2:393-3089(+)